MTLQQTARLKELEAKEEELLNNINHLDTSDMDDDDDIEEDMEEDDEDIQDIHSSLFPNEEDFEDWSME